MKKFLLFLFVISSMLSAEENENLKDLFDACMNSNSSPNYYGAECTIVGKMFEEGSGAKKSTKTALKIYKRGCDIGEGKSCAKAALFYSKGLGGAVTNKEKSMHYYKLACSGGGAISCFNYGVYMKRKGMVKKAIPFFHKGCEIGFGPSCNMIGGIYFNGDGATKSTLFALDYFSQGCDLEDEKSCTNVEVAEAELEEMESTGVEDGVDNIEIDG